MEAKEDILYTTEEYINSKLITGLKINYEAVEIKLSSEEAIQLVIILGQHISEASHKCISVYRDAFVHNRHTYNVCLSCGDFYRDDEHHYLTKEGIEKFKRIKYGIPAGKEL